MKTVTKLAVVIALANSATGAIAQNTQQGDGETAMSGPMRMSDTDAPAMQKRMQSTMSRPNDSKSTKEFKEADTEMMKKMDAPYTGNADVDFRTHMIPHHQGAIAMAKIALKYAQDAETKRMAQKIIDDQEKEVADMQAWLDKKGY
jgi:uncharacterized protein (DUF305 family)